MYFLFAQRVYIFGVWVLGYVAPLWVPIAPLTFPAPVALIGSLPSIGYSRFIIGKTLVNVPPNPIENSSFVLAQAVRLHIFSKIITHRMNNTPRALFIEK